ncbi:2-aminoethanethiol dioxygenase [Salix suchowensis]|nr:2-aminoethanethiol dioxygenase [Salix suchowensis]
MLEPRRESAARVHKAGYAKRSTKKKKICRRLKSVHPQFCRICMCRVQKCLRSWDCSLHHDVKRLCYILDNMKPEDLWLSGEHPFFNPRAEVTGTPGVTYTVIHKCDNFSLFIFFLPATAVIPLHNHPGMTFLANFFWGECTATGKPERDSILTAPCNTSVLYPTTGGNIHQFTAITPCAVLDVLGPPYSDEDGRDCSYYKELPYTSFSNGETGLKNEEGGCHAWLEEIMVPENSLMTGVEYFGPQVDKSSR